MKTYIYTLSDPITLEVRYVGKSNNPKSRYKSHMNMSRKHQIHKVNWINKLSKQNLKPKLDILDEVSVDEWKFWEKFWISVLKTWGYNLINYTNGGDGLTVSNDTSFKKGCTPWNKGINHSDKTKEKISESLTGKILSDETKEKMSKIKKGKPPPYMINGINDEILEKMSKTWFKKGNTINIGRTFVSKKRIKILQYNKETGDLIQEFDCVGDAGKEYNIIPEAIRRCCVGLSKSSCGYKWKYKNDKEK